MFTPRICFLIIIVAIIFGCVELNRGDHSAYLPFTGAALLIIGHFRYGPIRPAFLALQRGQFDTARRLVGSIRYPNLLSGQSKACFHWLRGALATLEPVDLSVAERELQLAVDGQLRTSNCRYVATAALAEVVSLSKDLDRANSLLDKASQMSHNDAFSTWKKFVTEFAKPTDDKMHSGCGGGFFALCQVTRRSRVILTSGNKGKQFVATPHTR